MSIVDATVELDDQFQALQKFVLEGSHAGLLIHAEAVKVSAQKSMQETSDDKEHAKPGEPPRVHTGKFRASIDVAESGGFIYVGSKGSEVGLRGAWFEFGGREQSDEAKKRSRRSKKRQWFPHPSIVPATKKEQPYFAQRVADATFISAK